MRAARKSALLVPVALTAVLIIATTGTHDVSATAQDVIVDHAVTFTVSNVNRSGVPCDSDGKTYTVRGHLVGPSTGLSRPDRRSVTVYLHGLELGEWFWRFRAAPRYDHAREMAKRGHVSVTVDRLGYNNSSHPPGARSCVGSQADVARQIVQQLRAGAYSRPGERAVAFPRVALAGHSLGGAITQVAAYSFPDGIDAIAVLSYADDAFTPAVAATSLTWGPICQSGGQPSERGAPGYAHLTASEADFRANFLAKSPDAVADEAAAQWDLNPCGDMQSLTQTAVNDHLRLSEIKAPVLILSGSDDLVFDANRVRLHAALFGTNPDVTTTIVPGATHGLTLEPTATVVRAELHDWLSARGF